MMFDPSVIYNKMTSQKNSLKKVQSHNLLASSGQVEQIWAAVQYPYFERKVFIEQKTLEDFSSKRARGYNMVKKSLIFPFLCLKRDFVTG